MVVGHTAYHIMCTFRFVNIFLLKREVHEEQQHSDGSGSPDGSGSSPDGSRDGRSGNSGSPDGPGSGSPDGSPDGRRDGRHCRSGLLQREAVCFSYVW